ncbi:hypothetical protein OUZ56_005732 [Daphnia magna]|uniref:Uncharacterized protein n=1 Tax=Daphnia magna TaxID=35525 RepID=A0ABQ9YTL8_9CRUS|nr:hypothetical protein OUZ56_005732 [Daphnia magna]
MTLPNPLYNDFAPKLPYLSKKRWLFQNKSVFTFLCRILYKPSGCIRGIQPSWNESPLIRFGQGLDLPDPVAYVYLRVGNFRHHFQDRNGLFWGELSGRSALSDHYGSVDVHMAEINHCTMSLFGYVSETMQLRSQNVLLIREGTT